MKPKDDYINKIANLLKTLSSPFSIVNASHTGQLFEASLPTSPLSPVSSLPSFAHHLFFPPPNILIKFSHSCKYLSFSMQIKSKLHFIFSRTQCPHFIDLAAKHSSCLWKRETLWKLVLTLFPPIISRTNFRQIDSSFPPPTVDCFHRLNI